MTKAREKPAKSAPVSKKKKSEDIPEAVGWVVEDFVKDLEYFHNVIGLPNVGKIPKDITAEDVPLAELEKHFGVKAKNDKNGYKKEGVKGIPAEDIHKLVIALDGIDKFQLFSLEIARGLYYERILKRAVNWAACGVDKHKGQLAWRLRRNAPAQTDLPPWKRIEHKYTLPSGLEVTAAEEEQEHYDPVQSEDKCETPGEGRKARKASDVAPAEVKSETKCEASGVGLRGVGSAAYGPHPASLGVNEFADAVPFIPSPTDPFPSRPREVVCEFLGFGLNLHVDTHHDLCKGKGECFVKGTRALLAVCRQGQLKTHFAEVLDQNLICPDGGVISANELFEWGHLIGGKTYSDNIKKRSKLAEPAVIGSNAQEVGLIKLHHEVESLWKARRSRIIAERDGIISDLKRQIHATQARSEEELCVLKAAWDPMSRVPEIEESDMSTRCFQKLLHEPGHLRPFYPTEMRVREAKAKYEEMVRYEVLLTYYRDDAEAKALALSDLCRRQVAVFSTTIPQWGRFMRLLADASLPSDASALKIEK